MFGHSWMMWRVHVSCQNNNLKSVHVDYIYHKNEIGKPGEMSLPIFMIYVISMN